jgi:hypothetical protein
MTRAYAPPLAASAVLASTTTAVLRRMERDYATTDTLSRRTVAAIYAVYAAHVIAIGLGTRLRVWPIPVRRQPANITGAAFVGAGACGVRKKGSCVFSWRFGIAPISSEDG